ncbi:hypothetical protein HMPREF0083_00152 [Aneurinibacillus aneurinilyticus ATCC 12856]|uniref:Uncharacterized protein n=1 Tax=Aneurinibacillus aneurinilyticus ATCC 12856 TaxID=649747 RepID=U1YLS8_ANEAE|nr:hypothetical protein HMPREF0083_00152 [Aneurinibacillus aneurinilyticus ATCC 12856]
MHKFDCILVFSAPAFKGKMRAVGKRRGNTPTRVSSFFHLINNQQV